MKTEKMILELLKSQTSRRKYTMRKVIRNNAQMLKIVWKYQKWIFVIAALFCICDIISPLQDTYLPKLIIDRLANAAAFEDMLPLILLFMAASIYKVLVYPAYKNYFSPLAKTRISNAMSLEMLENSKKLDLSCYENEEFYNRYTRALNELDSRAYSVFESVVSFARYALYLSVLSGVIVLLDPVLLLLGIGCAVVSFLFNKKIAGIEFEFQKGLTGDQRKCDYTKRILYVPEYAKETRFFRISDLLRVKFQKYGERKVTRYQENGRKITGLSVTSELVTTVVLHGVVVAYLVWRIVNHLLTPGDFIALLLATSQFSGQLSGLGDQINNFYKNALYVDNLNSILNYEPEIECFMSMSNAVWSLSQQLRNVFNAIPQLQESALYTDDIIKFEDYIPTVSSGRKEVTKSFSHTLQFENMNFGYKENTPVLKKDFFLRFLRPEVGDCRA